MKVLKIFGILLASGLIIALIMGLIAPSEFRVERSMVIQKKKGEIFPHVQYLKKREAWSPWLDYDPEVKNSYEGIDGKVGMIYRWDGNDLIGAGSQTVTKVQAPNHMQSDMHFDRPREVDAMEWVSLTEEKEGVKVSWGFSSRFPFPSNLYLLFNEKAMNQELGLDYTKGLERLKLLCESEYLGYQVNPINYPERHFVGLRKTITMDEITSHYISSFGAAGKVLAENGLEKTGMPCGLTYHWDEENNIIDLAGALPVEKATQFEGVENISLSAGPALEVNYYGSYDELHKAHRAIDAYLNAHGQSYKHPVIEEYITDPGTEPDPSKWMTKVVYLLEN